jgi:hypothetical protein
MVCKAEAECGAHLRGGRRAEGLTAAVAGERRILADVRSMSARMLGVSGGAQRRSLHAVVRPLSQETR